MERPLKTIKLEECGYTAHIVTYLTRGEVKEIDAKQFEGGEIEYVNDAVQIKKIPVNYRQNQEDALLTIGIKQLTNEKGEDITVSQETLDNLPNKDAKLLLFELNKVWAGRVGEVGKKK